MKEIFYTATAVLLTVAVLVVSVSLSPFHQAFAAPNQATVEVLGGGGGGGVVGASGGGGGGGGEYHKCTEGLSVQSYTVTVGAGATEDTTNETDSVFSGTGISLTADGGNGTTGAGAGTAGTGGTATGCDSGLTTYAGGTPAAGNTTGDVGGGGGGGGGYGGKGGNGAAGASSIGGGGGGGGGESAAGGNASGATAGTAGTGGGGAGGNGGNGAVGAAGSAGTPSTYHIVGGGGGGGGDDGLRGGACGAPGAGSGGGEVTGAGNGCRGEVRIIYVDSEIDATGGTESTSGIYRIHTFTTSGTFTVNSGNQPPTVALNTADATAFGADTTPTLDFTGTDTNSDDVRFNAQIDTSSSFNSSVLPDQVVGSYSESNSDAQTLLRSTDRTRAHQSFTAAASADLDHADFYISRVGTLTGNVVATLYAHSGTFGSSGVPTGSALATSDAVDAATLSTSDSLVSFNFTGAERYAMATGTNYFIGLEYSGGDSTNYIVQGQDSSTPSHGGNRAVYFGSWTASSAFDLAFYVYGDITSPLLSKVSGTDSGFANPDVGGDTDPFTSGDNIQFTVQGGDALSTGTYYWRVRGLDPSGSNTYGSWSSTRSFTISSGGGGGGSSTPSRAQSEFFF